MKLFAILPLAFAFTACALPIPGGDNLWLDDAVAAVLTGSGTAFDGASTGTARPLDTDTWDVTLQAGVHATIQLRGDGDTNLDLYLYDENGNLIDSHEGSSDYGTVSVTPLWTGKFFIVVVNRGWLNNHYSLRLI